MIGDDGIKQIGDSISNYNSLKVLKIEIEYINKIYFRKGNKIGSNGLDALGNGIGK